MRKHWSLRHDKADLTNIKLWRFKTKAVWRRQVWRLVIVGRDVSEVRRWFRRDHHQPKNLYMKRKNRSFAVGAVWGRFFLATKLLLNLQLLSEKQCVCRRLWRRITDRQEVFILCYSCLWRDIIAESAQDQTVYRSELLFIHKSLLNLANNHPDMWFLETNFCAASSSDRRRLVMFPIGMIFGDEVRGTTSS